MFMGLSLSHIFLSMRMKSIEISLRARATDMVVLYFQKGASVLGQNTFFDVLKYVAAQPPSHKSQSAMLLRSAPVATARWPRVLLQWSRWPVELSTWEDERAKTALKEGGKSPPKYRTPIRRCRSSLSRPEKRRRGREPRKRFRKLKTNVIN